MKHIYLFLFGLLLLTCCNNKQKQAQPEPEQPEIQAEPEIPKLANLEEGEFFYKSKNPFGETIELKGTQKITDTVIFKVSETQAIIKNDFMIMKNGRSFMLFQLPDLSYMGPTTGTFGRGPDEFIYPQLVSTPDNNILSYIFESTNQELYSLDYNGKITPTPFSFNAGKQATYSDKNVINIADNDFIYCETTPKGKSVFRTQLIGDSLDVKEVFNLALNPKLKSWTAYIGDFVANPKQNRMAYAYKYFKIIKFMDLDGKTVKTINFEKDTFDENTTYRLDGLDSNITHYWGACAQDKYVYFLYSGRTPYQVMQEWGKENYYIYVEQYDWNGNPIRKYKLDRWGYFTVDEKNEKLYLFSTTDDDPVFTYDVQL